MRDIEDLGSAILVKVQDTKIHHFGKVLSGNLQKVPTSTLFEDKIVYRCPRIRAHPLKGMFCINF
jgi:hypothetical protein